MGLASADVDGRVFNPSDARRADKFARVRVLRHLHVPVRAVAPGMAVARNLSNCQCVAV